MINDINIVANNQEKSILIKFDELKIKIKNEYKFTIITWIIIKTRNCIFDLFFVANVNLEFNIYEINAPEINPNIPEIYIVLFK